ncbi:MAG: TonB-dependent receptor [Phenylobacterium sp.]|nr:TonB-dependent receptor [Phenylobacterium sp.]MCA6248483.1 TonB-dependent receptor [Phenylobacterium sp.]MCA6251529.1 TonB-dependent receptor [Phenylobacterium sp.]MCA6256492.1 TonB-dependent receptor [Phenylobacterium sp.]MCA6266535.1 TonB-dependent receptor [Phenylobacterium sp.]
MACVAGPALAESASSVSEVVVTGQRQAYRGQFTPEETPQSLAVISQRILQDNNITGLTEALDLNAGVARQNNFGGLWDAYAVRGFAGDENLPSGYLVNGFNGGRGFGGPRDVAGVERIEILKGPNAALFGRGEPGGTVNIVTRKARFGETGGEVSASVGAFNARRADADVNLAAGEVVGARLIGFYEEAESFRRTVNTERYGFLPSFGFRLGEDTTVTYDLEITRQKAPFDRGVPAIGGVLGKVDRRTFLGEPGDGPIKADATGQQLEIQHDFSPAWSLLLGAGFRTTSLSGFSTEAELAASRQKLNVDGKSLSRQRRFRDYEADHGVLRAEVSGDFQALGVRHRLLVGADFDRFENSQLFLRFRPAAVSGNPSDQAANVIDVLNPVYGRFPLPAPGPQTNRLDVQEAAGLYLQDQISLSDALQIRLGVRYDDFSLESVNRATGVSQSRSESRLSPQVGLVWTATPSLSLFAAYGEGFRSNIGATAKGEIFDPEVSRAFEAGLRFTLLEGDLSGTLAVFSMRKSQVLAADPANPGFSLPIGKAGSQGVEFDLNGRLPGGVEALLSYAYVEAEARSDVLDPNFSLQIRKGDRLINVPRHGLNAQLARDFTLGETEVRLGAGVQHVGERLGETATKFELPAYTLVRLFGAWRATERVEVFGEVQNLFDETYYTNSFATLWVQPGAPRTGSVGVRLRF